MHVLCANIRSINQNLDSLLVFMSKLDLVLDVVVLTECWVDQDSVIPNINNFKSFSTTKSYNQNDGVIIYINDRISNYNIHEPVVSNGNCLVLNLNNDTTIVGLYRPSQFKNSACKSQFIDSLDSMLYKIKTSNIILTGDLNFDILPENLSGHAEDYVTMLASHGLRQGINRPTRLKACLDHFMLRTNKQAKTIVFDEITDHCPVLLHLNSSNYKKPDIRHEKIKLNIKNIEESLKAINWTDYYNNTSVDEVANSLISNIQNSVNSNITCTKIANRKKPLKPWITIGIIKSIRKRDKLHLKIKKNKSNEELKTQYLIYRNTCNKIIKTLKRKYYQKELEKNTGNSKETWKIVKELCNLAKDKTCSTELLSIKATEKDSLNTVNQYFTSIGHDLATETLNKINKNESSLANKTTLINPPQTSMFFSPTDPDEVRRVISSMKSKNSTGWDKISSQLIKTLVHVLASPIAHLCNLSLANGKFPENFKLAVVIPIFKAGDKLSPGNYRPISLLSTLSKILETIVNKRLILYLEDNKYLSTNQYGFRSGRSTEDAVLKLTTEITKHLDKGKKCTGVFLDLQKAFDTVSIPILLKRLETLGLRGPVQDWFRSYLYQRRQFVHLGGTSSDEEFCSYGVPQGSTLGPTLFLAYINQLAELDISGAEITMFADDTVLLFNGPSWESLQQTTENGLRRVTSWLEDSLLSLNTSKTKYLCFSKTNASKPPNNFSLTIHSYPCNSTNLSDPNKCQCSKLSRVNEIKYLGVIIDDRLKWVPHIKAVAKRLRKLIFVFKTLRFVASIKLLLETYKALGQSIITYCICSWGGACKTHLLEVERAQRVVLKVMLFLPFRHPTTKVYDMCKVLSVRKLFIYQSLRRYHRVTVPSLPLNTKRIDNCPVPNYKSVFARRHYTYTSPRIYNKLNLKYKTKKLSNYQIKTKIIEWLNKFDYDTTEDLLKVIK